MFSEDNNNYFSPIYDNPGCYAPDAGSRIGTASLQLAREISKTQSGQVAAGIVRAVVLDWLLY